MSNSSNNLSNLIKNTKNSASKLNISTIIMYTLVGLITLYILYRIYNDYSFHNSNKIMLVDGVINNNQQLQIKPDKIKRSIDGQYGIEFSYSFWIYVDSWTLNAPMIIFNKGSSQMQTQAPSVIMVKADNKLRLNLDTFSTEKETCDISNIPVKKWVHIIYVLTGKYLDVFVNGNLRKRCKLDALPRQNIDWMNVNMKHGNPNGAYRLSNLCYRSYSMKLWEIEREFVRGPNLKSALVGGMSDDIKYLADDYWLSTQYN